jgi:hypothetical protein
MDSGKGQKVSFSPWKSGALPPNFISRLCGTMPKSTQYVPQAEYRKAVELQLVPHRWSDCAIYHT